MIAVISCRSVTAGGSGWCRRSIGTSNRLSHFCLKSKYDSFFYRLLIILEHTRKYRLLAVNNFIDVSSVSNCGTVNVRRKFGPEYGSGSSFSKGELSVLYNNLQLESLIMFT